MNIEILLSLTSLNHSLASINLCPIWMQSEHSLAAKNCFEPSLYSQDDISMKLDSYFDITC